MTQLPGAQPCSAPSPALANAGCSPELVEAARRELTAPQHRDVGAAEAGAHRRKGRLARVERPLRCRKVEPKPCELPLCLAIGNEIAVAVAVGARRRYCCARTRHHPASVICSICDVHFQLLVPFSVCISAGYGIPSLLLLCCVLLVAFN